MSTYFKDLVKHYPKTGAARYWIEIYNWYKDFDDQDPIAVQVYNTWQRYGGPEEGGWWYEEGEPIQTHFIFNKKQAIQRAIKLSEEYDYANQPSITDSRGLSAIHIKYGDDFAKYYPEERPYYCWLTTGHLLEGRQVM